MAKDWYAATDDEWQELWREFVRDVRERLGPHHEIDLPELETYFEKGLTAAEAVAAYFNERANDGHSING